jgi:hypothetical protein
VSPKDLWGPRGAAKTAALVLSSKMDVRALGWMVDNTLGEDDALETFYESMPGFYKFDVVKDFPVSSWKRPAGL